MLAALIPNELGVGLALVVAFCVARLVGIASRVRRDAELFGRLLDLLALAARRAKPLAPVLERAATELRGRQRRWLEAVVSWLQDGHRLSAALAHAGSPRLPRHLQSAIEAAEGTEAFAPVLTRLARAEDDTRGMRYRFALAATYPALLAVLLLGLHAITTGAAGWWYRERGVAGFGLGPWVLALAGVSAAVWFSVSFPVWGGAWFGRRLPWIGAALQQLPMARVLQSTGTLLSAGLSLPEALRRAAPGAADRRTERGVRATAAALDVGASPAWAWQHGGLPDAVTARLCAMSNCSSGELASCCVEVAQQCRARCQTVLERCRRIIQPVAVLAFAAIVALEFGELVAWMDAARAEAEGFAPW